MDTKPDHENHEYVVGVIVIAAFLALSFSNLCIDQELQEEKYEDTKEEEFGVSIPSNCCGKVYGTKVALAIHMKKIHGKCSCYLGTINQFVQCNDCCFKFPTRTNLDGHLAMRHEVSERVPTRLKSERIESKDTNTVDANYEAEGRNVRKLCNLCEKDFPCSDLLKTHMKTVHEQKAFCYADLVHNFKSYLITLKDMSSCNDCGSTSAIRSHFGRHIQTTHVWTDHKMPAVTVSTLFTTEQDKDLTTKVVVRRMTAPLPFLLRWSRSHCCSPCLPPPCSLLCKTRSLLPRLLTCGRSCYCQVCLEHYTAAITADFAITMLLSASPPSSLFMAEMLLAALPGSRRFMTLVSGCVGFQAPLQVRVL